MSGEQCIRKDLEKIIPNIYIMEENNTEKKKLSYEQLENVCHQLSEQAKAMYQRLQEANLTNAFKRLDYLFEVVRKPEIFADYPEFYNSCKAEIVTALTAPESKEDKEDNKEEK